MTMILRKIGELTIKALFCIAASSALADTLFEGAIEKTIEAIDAARGGQPLWISNLINGPLVERPISIQAYQYRGEVVYLLNAPCCDRYNEVYSFFGDSICSPSGGYSGGGDRRCPSFFREAVLSEFHWSNNGKYIVKEDIDSLRKTLLDETISDTNRLIAAEKIVQICDKRDECILPLATVFEFSGSYYLLWESVSGTLCDLGEKASLAIPSLSKVLSNRKVFSDWRS